MVLGSTFCRHCQDSYESRTFRAVPTGNLSFPCSTVRYNMDHGAMLVEVNRSEAVFRFVTRSGVVVDSFSIAPR